MAFDSIEPFGERAADIRAALICRTIASALLKKENGEPFSLQDFMLDWTGQRPTRPSAEVLLQKVRMITDLLSGVNQARKEQEQRNG